MPTVNKNQEEFKFTLDDALSANPVNTGFCHLRTIERRSSYDSRDYSPRPSVEVTNEDGKIIGIANDFVLNKSLNMVVGPDGSFVHNGTTHIDIRLINLHCSEEMVSEEKPFNMVLIQNGYRWNLEGCWSTQLSFQFYGNGGVIVEDFNAVAAKMKTEFAGEDECQ